LDGVVVQPLGLQEQLVAVLVGEADDLVLDGRAITRPHAADLPRIHGRTVQVGADDGVGFRRGVGDAARHLGHGDALGQGGERHRRVVARLHLQRRPVDGAPIQPCRGSSLQARQREAGAGQRRRQTVGRRVTHPAGRPALLAAMDQAAQEGAGGDDDGTRADTAAVGQHQSGHPALADQQILGRAGQQGQIGGLVQQRPHGLAIELAVGLGARPLHRRPLAAVKDAELDAGAIDGASHESVEGVDLAHQLALGQAADSGVARHLAQRLEPLGDQQGGGAGARGGGGSLAAGMATADHHHVGHQVEARVLGRFHVKHLTCQCRIP